MRCTLVFAFAVLTSAPLSAAWFEDYARGLRAVRARQWAEAADHLSRSIKQMPNENHRARTYGTNFVAYHPYYYRGYSYLQLNRFEDAKRDFERAAGRGVLNLGELEDLKLKASSRITPPPPPTLDEVHPGEIVEVTSGGAIAEMPAGATPIVARLAVPDRPPVLQLHDSRATIEWFPKRYAVGWITLALINAGLAQSKQRSRLPWFLLSLILGPVATFLIVIFKRAESTTPR